MFYGEYRLTLVSS